jgi:hypothetical protein
MMTLRIVAAFAFFGATLQSPSYVVSAFPPSLRGFTTERRRGQAEAQPAKAGRRTVAQAPKAEMTRVPQFDNERAVSWKSVIPAHTESTPHRHDRFRTVIGIVGGDLTTVSADGHKTVTRYETGKAYFQAPMPPGEMHKDVNDTSKAIELIVVEMK